MRPSDVWDAILHEVALVRAEERPSTPQEITIAHAVKARIDAMMDAVRAGMAPAITTDMAERIAAGVARRLHTIEDRTRPRYDRNATKPAIVELAFGVRRGYDADADIQRALAAVARQLGAAPGRVLAIVGPSGHKVRWFALTSDALADAAPLPERKVVRTLAENLGELVVIARQPHHERPHRFELYSGTRVQLWIERDGPVVRSGWRSLGPAHVYGDVDEVGLQIIGVMHTRPFPTIAEATHEVVVSTDANGVLAVVERPMTSRYELPRVRAVQRWRSTRLEFTAQWIPPGAAEEVARVVREAERMSDEQFRVEAWQLATELALLGSSAVARIVDELSATPTRPRVAWTCLRALGQLRARPEIVLSYVADPVLGDSACAALASMADAARPVLVEATRSADVPTRRAALALLGLLYEEGWAELRATRRERDQHSPLLDSQIQQQYLNPAHLAYSLLDGSVTTNRRGEVAHTMESLLDKGSDALVAFLDAAGFAPELPWALALVLIESALPAQVAQTLVRIATQALGDTFTPVLDALASFPPTIIGPT